MGNFATYVGAQTQPKPTAPASAPMFTTTGFGLKEPNLLPQLNNKEQHGVLGFFGNLLENVYEIGSGAVNLFVGSASDIGKLGAEALTLGKADTGSYFIPNLATNIIPAIGHDLAKRYGGLMPWSFDLGRVANEFYDNPGFFAADAFMAAGAAGKVAEAGALGTRLAPSVAKVAAPFASKEGGLMAGIKSAATEALAKEGSLGGLAREEALAQAAASVENLSTSGMLAAAKRGSVPIYTKPLSEGMAETLATTRTGRLPVGYEGPQLPIPKGGKTLDWLVRPPKGPTLLEDINVLPENVTQGLKMASVPRNPLTRSILKPLTTGTAFGKELPTVLRGWALEQIPAQLVAKTQELAKYAPESTDYKRIVNEIEVLKTAQQQGAQYAYRAGQRSQMARNRIANYIVSHHMASYSSSRNAALLQLDKLLDAIPEDPEFNPTAYVDIMRGTRRSMLNWTKPELLDEAARKLGFDDAQAAADALWDPTWDQRTGTAQRATLMGDGQSALRRQLHMNQIAGKLDANGEYVLYQPSAEVMALPGRQRIRQRLIDAGKTPTERAWIMKHLDVLHDVSKESWEAIAGLSDEELAAEIEALRAAPPPKRGPNQLFKQGETPPDEVYMTPAEEAAAAAGAAAEAAPEEIAAQVGVTSYRRGRKLAKKKVSETLSYFNSSRAKRFEGDLEAKGAEWGVSVDEAPRTAGYFDGDIEPSWAPKVRGRSREEIEGYAAELALSRGPDSQDSVMIFYPEEAADSVIAFDLPEGATEQIGDLLAKHEIVGATIKGNRIEIANISDFGDVSDNVVALADELGVDHANIQEVAGTVKFIERGDNNAGYLAAIERGRAKRRGDDLSGEPEAERAVQAEPALDRGEAAVEAAPVAPGAPAGDPERLARLEYEQDARARGVDPSDRFYDRFDLRFEEEFAALEDAQVERLFMKRSRDGTQPARSQLDDMVEEMRVELGRDKALKRQFDQIRARAGKNMDHFLFDKDGNLRTDIEGRDKILAWYRNSKAALHEVFAGQNIRLGDGSRIPLSEMLVNLIAVTSNNIDPMNNLRFAIEALDTYVTKIVPDLKKLRESGLEPGTPEFATAAEEVYMRHWPSDNKGMLQISKDGARDVFRGNLVSDWTPEQQLSKPKLTAFFQNLMGNFTAGTNDSIMRKAQYGDPRMSTIGGGGLVKGRLNPAAKKYLLEVEATSVEYARRVNAEIDAHPERFDGLRGVQPADMQALAWVQYKRGDAMWRRGWSEALEEALETGYEGTIRGERKAMLANTWAAKRMLDKGRLPLNEKQFLASIRDLPEAERAAAKADRAALKVATLADLKVQMYDMLGAWENVRSPRFKGKKDVWIAARKSLKKDLKGQATRAELTGGDFSDFLTLHDDVIKRLKDEGDILFKQAGDEILGVAEFGPSYGAVVRLFRNADFTTFIHEMGHVVRRMLDPEELAAFRERYKGMSDVDAEEAFADELMGWYGPKVEEAPIVNQLFNKVKTWITNLWDQNRALMRERDALTPEQEAVFERYIGRAVDELAQERRPSTVRPTEVARALRQIAIRDDQSRPLPDGSFEPKILGDAATLALDAERNRVGLGQLLRDIFQGSGRLHKVQDVVSHVRTRAKSAAAIADRLEMGGSAADALGARVTIASWNEVPAMLAKLEEGLKERGGQILSIEDGRATPRPGTGERTVRAFIQDADGTVSEVEFGTLQYDRVRNVGDVRAKMVNRHRRELDDAERYLAEIEKEQQTNAANPKYSEKDYEAAVEDVERWTNEVRDGEAMQQQRWEGIADEVDNHVNGVERPGGVNRDWYDQMRLWVDEHIENPTINYFGEKASSTRLLNRTYLAEAMRYGAEYDPATRSFRYPTGVDGPSAWDLHMQRMNNGDVAPIYYPDMQLEGITPSSWTMPHSMVGARKRAANKFIKGTKGVIGEERSTNVRDVYALRATAALKHLEANEIIRDITTRLGRRIEAGDDIDFNTERVFAPDGLLRFFGLRMRLNDALIKALKEGEGLAPQVFADEYFDVVKEALIENMGGLHAATKQGLDLWAVPKNVAEQVERYYRISGAEPSLRLFWDSWHKLWRGLVLAGSPRWIANNIFGNMVFGFMQGAHLSDVLRQLKVRIGKYEWEADPVFRGMLEDIMPASAAEGVKSGLFATEGPESLAHYGAAGDTTTAKIYQWMGSRRPVVKLKTLGHYTRAINAAVEDAFRSSSYLRAAERNAAKAATVSTFRRFWLSKEDARLIGRQGITEDLARKFVDEVNYFFNDYNGLGNIERMYIRRFLMPFYSFYRHIASLVVRFPFEYTGKWWLMQQMAIFDKEMEEEMGLLPEWLKGAMPLTDVRQGEATPYLLTAGPNPFNVLDTNSIISLMDPAFKVLAENAVGRNTFTGKEFTAPDVVTTYGGKKFRIIRDGNGNVVSMEPVDKVSPGIVEQMMQQVPQYNMLKDLFSGGRAYDTQSLPRVMMNAATGNPQPVMGYDGTPMAPVSPVQLAGKFMGVNVIPYDVESYQASQERAALEAYKAYLRQQQAIAQ